MLKQIWFSQAMLIILGLLAAQIAVFHLSTNLAGNLNGKC